MVVLVVTTVAVAMREKKARTKALEKMRPKPLDPTSNPGANPMAREGDNMGADAFGVAEGELPEFDENAVR